MMHNLKTETLASANNLDVRKPLTVGQKLVIPGGKSNASATASAKKSTVKPGAPKESPKPDVAAKKTAKPVEPKPDVALTGEAEAEAEVDTLFVDTRKQSADDIIDSLTKDEDPAVKDEVNLLIEDTKPEAPANAEAVGGGVAAATTAAPAAIYVDHEVTRGETVDIIAKQYGMTPKQILDLNPGLNAKDPLKEGSKVKIP
jgi:LysM repeat protein